MTHVGRRQRDTQGPARLVTKHFTHERETFSPYRETCALGLYREGLRRYTMRWPVLGRWRVRVTPHITPLCWHPAHEVQDGAS